MLIVFFAGLAEDKDVVYVNQHALPYEVLKRLVYEGGKGRGYISHSKASVRHSKGL